MKATFCKATHHFIAGHAHHTVDKLSDDKHYLANFSESIAHQNTTRIICRDYNGGPNDDLYWSNPMDMDLLLKCIGHPFAITFRHYKTKHKVRFTENDGVTREYPVFVMKVEFLLEGEERRKKAKGKARYKSVIWVTIYELVDDDEQYVADGDSEPESDDKNGMMDDSTRVLL